jgi:hypothetical protein
MIAIFPAALVKLGVRRASGLMLQLTPTDPKDDELDRLARMVERRR